MIHGIIWSVSIMLSSFVTAVLAASGWQVLVRKPAVYRPFEIALGGAMPADAQSKSDQLLNREQKKRAHQKRKSAKKKKGF